jgi:CheY-like chemotaxis protein
MTKRYEIARSSDEPPLVLIFLEGSWESLPFEVRLLCPWHESEFCDRGSLTTAQRLDIETQGYYIANAPASHLAICDEERSTPRRRQTTQARPCEATRLAMGAPSRFAEAPKTILVVEDEVCIRFDVTETLTSAGFHVIPVSTADEALEVLLLLPMPIDLVFTDVRMPGSIDGLGLARRVQSEWPHIKVVVASGHLQMPSDLVPAASFGKPYLPAVVTDCIGGLLRS